MDVAKRHCRLSIDEDMLRNPAWVQIHQEREQLLLSYRHRLEYLATTLPFPGAQCPSIVLCIGKTTSDRGHQTFKDAALSHFFPNNALPSARLRNSFANIFLDECSVQADAPVYFAETNPRNKGRQDLLSVIKEKEIYRTPWKVAHAENAINSTYSRLLFQFSDVVCIFANDFSSYANLLRLIRDWIQRGSSSNLPECTRPRLVVINYIARETLSPGPHREYCIDDLEPLLETSHGKLRSAFFSAHRVDVVEQAVAEKIISRLRMAAVHQRRRARVGFSAEHLAALFSLSLRHFCARSMETFDYIRAVRARCPIPREMVPVMSTFTQLAKRYTIKSHDLAILIALSILLDAYPDRMHLFDVRDVFHSLYREKLLAALQVVHDEPYAGWIVKLVSQHLQVFFARIELGERAAEVHKNETRRLRFLRVLHSNRCCLYCLMARPEHVLGCNHALCDRCVRRFGTRASRLEHVFQIGRCHYCDWNKKPLIVELKPPTAGVRILSVDGGGVRGIVPLQYLSLIQQSIGEEMPVQDLFDVAFGTSAGGLIVLGLFIQRWSIEECVQRFNSLTRDFFSARRPKSMLRSLHRYYKGFMSNGIYDTEKLERCLQENFGEASLLFTFPTFGVSRVKAAVVATTTEDTTAMVLSNYNGAQPCASKSGYKHLRAHDAVDELPTWKAARATSAAPVFFKPADLGSAGVFQDGCLKHNNPTRVALWESSRLWNVDPIKDMVVSMGTGKRADLEAQSHVYSPIPRDPQRRSSDGLVPRIFRSFSSSMDGENLWQDLLNGMPSRSRRSFHRLNVVLDKEPDMDDASAIDRLRDAVDLQATRTQIAEIVTGLLATNFYFELDRPPVLEGRDDAIWRCFGRILCRTNPQRLVRTLSRFHSQPLELMISGKVPQGEAFEPELCICSFCLRLCKHVTFQVRHPSETIEMSVGTHGNSPQRISGFPKSMGQFVDEQQLITPFGIGGDAPQPDRCSACDGHPFVPPLKVRKRKPGMSLALTDIKRTRMAC